MSGVTQFWLSYLLEFIALQEEDISNLVECMALNSASTTSDSESEVSEVRKSVQYLKLMI